LNDPALSAERDGLHTSQAQHRRFFHVVSKTAAIDARLFHQQAVISACGTVELRRNLNFDTLDFDNIDIHKNW
jgi:hypothetical protein